MSSIIRYALPDTGEIAVGISDGESVIPISSSLAELLQLPAKQLHARCGAASGKPVPSAQTIPLPPIDGRTEVWGAGGDLAPVPPGPDGRKQGLLDAALMRCQTSAFGEDTFPTIHDKAAALLTALINYHASRTATNALQ